MIRVLEKNIADKIAAGEVVERPISVVKELVENSIDAGSKSITCEIKNGGKSFIRVTDNGRGIPNAEAETAFLRHATSKIETLNDLNSINSLGFRGEALASIAAVTRTSLVTKTSDENMGKRIINHGGNIIENASVGCPVGTTIIVTDLFYNTPARRKFLKSDGGESSLIIDFMSEIALAYPYIRIQLINNSKTIFTTRGDGNQRNTLSSVYKRKEYEDLAYVNYNSDNYRITGCISKPSLSRSSRREQVFFVNGRVVKSKIIDKGIALGYKERLFEGRYPIIFLFIETNPGDLDVNIHPNKREIRFNNEDEAIYNIKNAIIKTLSEKEALVEVSDYYTPEIINAKEEKSYFKASNNTISKNQGSNEDINLVNKKLTNSEEQVDIKNLLKLMREEDNKKVNAAYDNLSDNTLEYIIDYSHEKSKDFKSSSDFSASVKPNLKLTPAAYKPFDFTALKVTGNIFDTYITCTDDKNFYLIDQHAAQERIFYEKLVGEYLSNDKPSQLILTPITIDVPLSVSEDSYSWMDYLSDIGYSIESFGPNSYIVREIPYFMEIGEAETFLKEFLEQLDDKIKWENTVVIDKLIMRSCKSAIKAHDKLSYEEEVALINDLGKCINPFSCPHGRPTFLRFSNYDIERMFKRA